VRTNGSESRPRDFLLSVFNLATSDRYISERFAWYFEFRISLGCKHHGSGKSSVCSSNVLTQVKTEEKCLWYNLEILN
jgi:hypothetical protein